MKHYFLFLIFAIYSFNSIYSQDISPELEQLVEWMSGSFSSAAQAKADDSFESTTLKIVQIWPDVTNGAWVYAEEFLNDEIETTVNQRVFFLSEINDSEFSIDEYELPNKLKYVGAWEDPNRFSEIRVFDLKFKNGCTFFIFYDGFQYSGQTNTGSCKNEVDGAAYSTSVIMVVADEINLWDRGYNESNQLVWGTDAGPKVYKKL